MDFSPKGIKRKQDDINSSPTKVKSKIFIIAFRVFITLLISFSVIGIFLISGFVKGIIDKSPELNKIDVVPKEYPTEIYDINGELVQELTGENSNREYVSLDKIPKHVQEAFIAIEDERFYEHNGIDIKGIFRASVSGVSNGFSQGASTITQQLIKNTIFDFGMESTFYEKLQRKVQEQYLSIRLENKLTKKEILEYYLNTINLGATTRGVQTASMEYFDKPVSELNVAEAAVIASITKHPTALNPIEHPKKNKQRMLFVLKNMYNQKYITKKEYNAAKKTNVYEEIHSVALKHSNEREDKKQINSYFVDAMYESVLNDLVNKADYSREEANKALNTGGLKIYTTLDKNIQDICDDVINDESNYPSDKRKLQLNYDISIRLKDGTVKNYSVGHLKNYFKEKESNFDLYFNDKDDAKKYIKEFKEHLLKDGAELITDKEDFIIQPQISFSIIDHQTGAVKAIVGGRGEKTTNRAFNRSTGSYRDPGSTFKLVAAYIPALDASGMTLATVYNDAKYKDINSSHKGLTTIREAIYTSNNIVAVKTYEDVTPSVSTNYIENLGITSLQEEDAGYSVALGGLTKGVSNLELTAAYSAMANKGTYNKPYFYTKVVDSQGNVILEHKGESKQVMKETTAWLLTDAMHDTVTRGTGTLCNFSGMFVAGKTGTSQETRDLWFAGFTPYYTAAIWTGYDLKDVDCNNGNKNYHKIIWRKIMSRVHQGLDNTSFAKPNGISSISICTKCGQKAIGDLCSHAYGGSEGQFVKTEYFASSTAPSGYCTCHQKLKICSVTGYAASEYCPASEIVYLIKDKATSSSDSKYIAPEITSTVCTQCDGSGVINELFGPGATAAPDNANNSETTANNVASTTTPVVQQ